jgi:hypothetical protein
VICKEQLCLACSRSRAVLKKYHFKTLPDILVFSLGFKIAFGMNLHLRNNFFSSLLYDEGAQINHLQAEKS